MNRSPPNFCSHSAELRNTVRCLHSVFKIKTISADNGSNSNPMKSAILKVEKTNEKTNEKPNENQDAIWKGKTVTRMDLAGKQFGFVR